MSYFGIPELNFPAIDSYADAEAALDARRKRRKFLTSAGDLAYPLGAPTSRVTSIRRDDAGDIHMRLHDLDMVVWHADDSFTLASYDSRSSSNFASRAMPSGVWLNAGGRIQLRRGAEHFVGFADGTYRKDSDGVWHPESGRDMTWWEPRDPKTVRELTRHYRLADFALWLDVAPDHTDVEHDIRADVIDCVEALADGDFRKAACALPTIEVNRGFGRETRTYNIRVSGRYAVGPRSLDIVREAILEHHDALVEHSARVIPMRKWARLRKNVRHYHRYGDNI